MRGFTFLGIHRNFREATELSKMGGSVGYVPNSIYKLWVASGFRNWEGLS